MYASTPLQLLVKLIVVSALRTPIVYDSGGRGGEVVKCNVNGDHRADQTTLHHLLRHVSAAQEGFGAWPAHHSGGLLIILNQYGQYSYMAISGEGTSWQVIGG
jgi:hypothetical protein